MEGLDHWLKVLDLVDWNFKDNLWIRLILKNNKDETELTDKLVGINRVAKLLKEEEDLVLLL